MFLYKFITMNSSLKLVLVVLFVLVSHITSNAARTGSMCNSNYGAGSCEPIAQCGHLSRMRLSGKSPVMCGFDHSGPVVCCPKVFEPRQSSRTRPMQSRPFFDFDLNDDPYIGGGGDSQKQNNLLYDTPALTRPDFDSNSWSGVGRAQSRPQNWGQQTTRRPSLHEKPQSVWQPQSNGANIGESSFTNVQPQFPDLAPDSWSSVNNNNNNRGSPATSGFSDSGLRKTSTTEKPFIWSSPPKKNYSGTNNQGNKGYGSNEYGKTRISSIVCEEYKKMMTSEKCAGPVELIVGGSDAEVGEFPHMVAIGYSTFPTISWDCGGTLISKNYVLTAGHCITSTRQPVKVRLGTLNLKNPDRTYQDINVERWIVHPRYKWKKYFDIALLVLSWPAHFNANVHPACLAQPDDRITRATATGWGRRGTVYQKSIEKLQKVDINIIGNEDCRKIFRNSSELTQGIVDEMLCAGGNNQDTCSGDSGGPLQFTKLGNRCVHHIYGLTSFGGTECGQIGVYTRVSSYLNWIEKEVWPEYFEEY